MADQLFPELSKWQRMVYAKRDKWWLLLGGRRVTKSTTCYLRGVDVCLHGGTTAWYCASEDLADENWQDICDFCAPYASRINREQKGVMWFDNSEYGKGVFKRKSGFNKWAGRAGTLDLLLFDEIQLLKKALFNRALPSILTTRGHIAATLTPPETPSEYHQSAWLKDIVDSRGVDGLSKDRRFSRWFITNKPTEPWDVAFVFMMRDVNNGLPGIQKTLDFYRESISYSLTTGYAQKGKCAEWDKYLRDATDSLQLDRDELGDDDYKREYECQWTLDTSRLVYDNIRDGIHRRTEFDYDPASPVVWGIDRGEGKGYHVVLFANRIKIGQKEIKDPNYPTLPGQIVPIYVYRTFDEIATKDVISEGDMISNALELCKEKHYKLPVHAVYDVRAPGYRKALRDAGIFAVARNVNVEEGIRRVKRMMGRQQIQLHPRCVRLWQNLTNYARDEKGFPSENDHNDAADALRYMVWVTDTMDGIVSDIDVENQQAVSELAVEQGVLTNGAALWLAF